MSKNIAFIRVNKNNPEYTVEQSRGILKFLKEKKINLDDSINIEISLPSDEHKMNDLITLCDSGNSLYVYDLHILGRTTDVILDLLKDLLNKNIKVFIIKHNLNLVSNKDMLTKMILGVMSMTLKLEKELMSIRTKEALMAKKIDGVMLGKPKGTIQKSKFDKQRDRIEELLAIGLSTRKIAKLLGYNNHIGLNNYIKKRGLRELVESNKEEQIDETQKESHRIAS
ncbi:MAG: recombinase family protein [Arcobacter butzleri]|jgi:DNA invertase Pin-like site-specific DNA recombinase|nr:recombinase family protein [Arcobacteraceae bacterium]MDY0365849.1 recombinase family protein [Arcobacteraceae bacterium]NLO17930.1 recombinase family protein [Aliarcobacter butzleri]